MKAKVTFAAILVVAAFAFIALAPITDNDADFAPSVEGTYTYVKDLENSGDNDRQHGTLTYTETLDAESQVSDTTIYIELDRASARDSSVFLKSRDIAETEYGAEISIMNRVSGNAWTIDGISGAPLEKGKHYCITVRGSGITEADATFEFDLQSFAKITFAAAEIDEEATDYSMYPAGHQTQLELTQSIIGVVYGQPFTAAADHVFHGFFVTGTEAAPVVPTEAADFPLVQIENTDAYSYEVDWTKSYYYNSNDAETKLFFKSGDSFNTLYALSETEIHLVFTPTITKFNLAEVVADVTETATIAPNAALHVGDTTDDGRVIPYGAQVTIAENGSITFKYNEGDDIENFVIAVTPAENYTFNEWQVSVYNSESSEYGQYEALVADSFIVDANFKLKLFMTDSEEFQLILNERAGYYYEITIADVTMEVFSTTDDATADDALILPKNTIVFIKPVAINGYTSNLSLSYVLGAADPATASSELVALYKVGATEPGTEFPAKVVVNTDSPESATADDWVKNEYAFQMTADLEIDIVLVDAADLEYAEVTDVKYAGPVQYNFTDGFIFVQVDNANEDKAAKAITLSLGYKADATAAATDLTAGTDYYIIALSANTFKITGIVQDGHANGIIVITAAMDDPEEAWDEFYIASIDAAGVHVVMRNVNSDAVIDATELATIGSYSKTVGTITKYGALGAFEITAMTDADGADAMQAATGTASATEATLAAANQSTAYYATLSFGAQNVYSVQAMASDADDAQTTLWVLA